MFVCVSVCVCVCVCVCVWERRPSVQVGVGSLVYLDLSLNISAVLPFQGLFSKHSKTIIKMWQKIIMMQAWQYIGSSHLIVEHSNLYLYLVYYVAAICFLWWCRTFHYVLETSCIYSTVWYRQVFTNKRSMISKKALYFGTVNRLGRV